MTLVVRYLDPPAFADLGAAGWVRVGLAEVVGIWGAGPNGSNLAEPSTQPNRANATGGVMTKVQKRSPEPLRDVLYQFSMAKEIPDPELLDEYVRLYPDYAEPLTDFAVQLAVESKQPKTAEVPTPEARVSPVVSRAMSRFQSAIHSAKTSRSISPAIESGDP